MIKNSNSKYVSLSLDEAERTVNENSRLSWDGWVINEDIPNDRAFASVQGVFNNGRWFKRNRYTVDHNGLYCLPKKYVNVKS